MTYHSLLRTKGNFIFTCHWSLHLPWLLFRKTPEPEDAEEETVVMLSDKKIAEYVEAEDPDYVPTEEATPVDPLEYDSAVEISQGHITEDEVA